MESLPDLAIINGLETNDTLTGSIADELIVGFGGNDVISGEAGDDILLSGSLSEDETGNVISIGSDQDTLIGGTGSDILVGDNGSDVLIGVNRNTTTPGIGEIDVLTGGLGADSFVLGDENQVYYLGDGIANITDFNRGEGDKIIVHGQASDYSLNLVEGELEITYQGTPIGVISNTSEIDLAADFQFI